MQDLRAVIGDYTIGSIRLARRPGDRITGIETQQYCVAPIDGCQWRWLRLMVTNEDRMTYTTVFRNSLNIFYVDPLHSDPRGNCVMSHQEYYILIVTMPSTNRDSLWLLTTMRINAIRTIPDSKVQGVNMGPTWVLSAPDGPHVGPMNLAIRDCLYIIVHYPSMYAHFTETIWGPF